MPNQNKNQRLLRVSCHPAFALSPAIRWERSGIVYSKEQHRDFGFESPETCGYHHLQVNASSRRQGHTGRGKKKSRRVKGVVED